MDGWTRIYDGVTLVKPGGKMVKQETTQHELAYPFATHLLFKNAWALNKTNHIATEMKEINVLSRIST